jgi:hypothetical protein
MEWWKQVTVDAIGGVVQALVVARELRTQLGLLQLSMA